MNDYILFKDINDKYQTLPELLAPVAKETATDEEAMYNIKKVEFDGLVYGQGGTVLEDDGNWWFTVSGCTGNVGDTLIARYYDWDDQLVGTIMFVKQ